MIRMVAGRCPTGRAFAFQVEPEEVSPAVAAAIPNAERGLTAADLRVTLGLAYPAQFQCIRNIQDTVAEFYGIHPKYMRQRDEIGSREPRVSHPRQVAMFFARELTSQPLTDIGRRFKRDHSTVIHGVRAVKNRAADDPLLTIELEVLRERLSV